MQHSEHPTFFSQGHRMVHHCWIRAHHEWKESSSFQSLAICDIGQIVDEAQSSLQQVVWCEAPGLMRAPTC